MLLKKTIIVFLMFAFWGFFAGCEKKPKTKEEHYNDGTLAAIYTYNDAGLLDGVVKKYYPGGKLKIESTYKNNVKEGVEKDYFESGNVKYERNYKNGKEEGTTKLYYESGGLHTEIDFKDGKPEGAAKLYDGNGSLRAKADYKNGIELSRTCYDEQGNNMRCPAEF